MNIEDGLNRKGVPKEEELYTAMNVFWRECTSTVQL